MSEAKMCDRCGEYFKPEFEDIVRPSINGFRISRICIYPGDGTLHCSDLMDFCPKCANKFYNFMHQLSIADENMVYKKKGGTEECSTEESTS